MCSLVELAGSAGNGSVGDSFHTVFRVVPCRDKASRRVNFGIVVRVCAKCFGKPPKDSYQTAHVDASMMSWVVILIQAE